MLSGMRGQEWLIILFIILLLFGAKKLPEMARGLGRSVRILKSESKAAEESLEEEEKSVNEESKKEGA
jgi:sec-independent protein translocase protein TatA